MDRYCGLSFLREDIVNVSVYYFVCTASNTKADDEEDEGRSVLYEDKGVFCSVTVHRVALHTLTALILSPKEASEQKTSARRSP